MNDTNAPSPELVRLVRSALAHLYDYAYLQNNPLTSLVDPASGLERVARAQKLRRLLVDCIEALKPQGESAPASQASRAYPILTYRYIDGLSMADIARKRALSLRQAYREHQVGVEAVARLLRDRLRSEGSPDILSRLDAPSTQMQELQAEVARLRQAVRPESLDLRNVLDGVLALLAPLSQRTGSAIQVADTGPYPLVVADRVMLRQALLSVLSHALSAAAPGRLALSILPEKGRLRLDLRGLPRNTDGESLPPGAGKAGVGLTAAEGLLEAQGGQVEIRVGADQWRALIYLPTAARTTILAIDDNADLVSLLQRYLGGYDVTVVGATEGSQALRLAQELRPQLITLDVMMPGQDGWEILQDLKNTPETERIPVIVCSVLNEAQLAETMGASDYITKPISQADLLAVLRHWLGPLRPAS